jgi:hypothetical protein
MPGISTSSWVSWPADHAAPIAPTMVSRRPTQNSPAPERAAWHQMDRQDARTIVEKESSPRPPNVYAEPGRAVDG